MVFLGLERRRLSERWHYTDGNRLSRTTLEWGAQPIWESERYVLETRKKSILIIGAESDLSGPLRAYFLEGGFEVHLTSRREVKPRDSGLLHLDLLDPLRKNALPQVDFALILAGITGEEACQANPELSRGVNLDGTVRIARELVSRGTFVVFLSSSRVFDGATPNPSPGDPIRPIGLYGTLKAEAEAVLSQLENLAILRLTRVAGSRGHFAEKISAKLAKGETVSFSPTIVTSPLSFNEVYAAILRIISRGASGVFQLGGQESMTEVQFAQSWLSDFPELLAKIDTNAMPNSENPVIYESLATHLPPNRGTVR